MRLLQPLRVSPDVAPWAISLTFPHSVATAPARELDRRLGRQGQHGAMLVEEAGKTMEDVVSSVRRVSDIVAEISAGAPGHAGGMKCGRRRAA